MSTLKSSAEDLTLNADGSGNDIKFQSNGVEKASISSAGAFTSTTIDATALTGNLPAISAANLTNVPAANITGTLPAIDGSNLTGLSSGLSEADQWRITTDAGGSGVVNLTANWERADTYGSAHLGTGMTESSGIFTFPSTGYWIVNYQFRCNQVNVDVRYIMFDIEVSTDSGSSFDAAAQGAVNISNFMSGTEYNCGSVSTLIDVTNISTFQVRANFTSSVSVTVDGHTSQSETGLLFYKVGDT
jgi:hypothetical protein